MKFYSVFTDDVKWREQELALVKKAVLRKDQTSATKIVQRRYAIPAIYAIWEGFVVTTFSEYIKKINAERISVKFIQDNIFAFHLFQECNLHETPTAYEKRIALSRKIRGILDSRISIGVPIKTNSNVDFNELVFLMRRFVIPIDGLEAYRPKLMQLVSIRNKIAHGTKNVLVSESVFGEMINLVENLMSEVVDRVERAISNRCYLIDSFEMKHQEGTAK